MYRNDEWTVWERKRPDSTPDPSSFLLHSGALWCGGAAGESQCWHHRLWRGWWHAAPLGPAKELHHVPHTPHTCTQYHQGNYSSVMAFNLITYWHYLWMSLMAVTALELHHVPHTPHACTQHHQGRFYEQDLHLYGYHSWLSPTAIILLAFTCKTTYFYVIANSVRLGVSDSKPFLQGVNHTFGGSWGPTKVKKNVQHPLKFTGISQATYDHPKDHIWPVYHEFDTSVLNIGNCGF